MSDENEELNRWMEQRKKRAIQQSKRLYRKSDVQNITDFLPDEPGLLDMNEIIPSEQGSFLTRSNNVYQRIRELLNRQKMSSSNLQDIDDEVISNIIKQSQLEPFSEEITKHFQDFPFYYCGSDDFSDKGSMVSYNENGISSKWQKNYDTNSVKFTIISKFKDFIAIFVLIKIRLTIKIFFL